MASKIEVPFVDEDVDPTQPVNTVKTVGMLALGVMVFIVVSVIGSTLASRAIQTGSEVLGIENPEGDNQFEVSF